MRIRIKAHGLLTVGVDHPEGLIELDVPAGSDIAGVFDLLGERSPIFDPRACLILVDGAKVSLDRVLKAGDEVRLYHLFSGG